METLLREKEKVKMLKEMELSSAPLRFTPARKATPGLPRRVRLRQKGSLVAELGAVTRNYVSRKFYHFVLFKLRIFSNRWPRRKRILRQGWLRFLNFSPTNLHRTSK